MSTRESIPTRRQRYSDTCGYVALEIVARHYGVDPAPMGAEADWAERPLTMVDIGELAEKLRLNPRIGLVDRCDLTRCPTPSITLVNHAGAHPPGPRRTGGRSHFMVVFRATDEHVFLSDPGVGRALLASRRWFDKVWTGVVAVFDHPRGSRGGGSGAAGQRVRDAAAPPQQEGTDVMDHKPTTPKPDELVIRPVARRKLAEMAGSGIERSEAHHSTGASSSPPVFCACSEHAFDPEHCGEAG